MKLAGIHGFGNYEIEMKYQPQFNLNSHSMVSVEALSRFKGEPNLLFKAAEIGIEELGYSVIRQVAQQIKKWKSLGIKPVRTFINIAPTQIRPDFFRNVCILLEEYEVNHHEVGFEFTEMLDYNRLTIEELDQIYLLHNNGIEVAMDDFGMGATDIRCLELGFFDKVKLDKKFVTDIQSKGTLYTITRNMVNITKDLGLGLIAEGIETISQKDALIEAGVSIGQGFLLSLPLPANDLYVEGVAI